MSEDVHNISGDTQEEEQTCFLCNLPGDPINNKLKKVTDAVVATFQKAVEQRKTMPENVTKKSIDVSVITLPTNIDTVYYHQPCYRKIVNISGYKRVSDVSEESSIDDVDETARDIENVNTFSPKNKYGSICIFCGKCRLNIHGVYKFCSMCTVNDNYESFQQVMHLATEMNVADLCKKIEEYYEENLPIPYHPSCKNEFLTKQKPKKENSEWHYRRYHYQLAKEQVFLFIEEHVIQNHSILEFSFLKNLFCEFLLQAFDTQQQPTRFYTVTLQTAIIEKFAGKVKLFMNRNIKYIVSTSTTFENINMKWVNEENTIKSAALLLRRLTLSIEKKKIERDIDAKKLIEGECQIPAIISDFFLLWLTGGRVDNIQNARMLLLAKSMSQDIIYGVHRGRMKTSKHITLASTFKSLTSSKKLLNIIHSYGHCISYDGILALETEAAFHLTKNTNVCPREMVLQQDEEGGYAWDNFDRFVDSSKGGGILHDTVGISFTKNVSSVEVDNVSHENESIEPVRKKMRRHFEIEPTNIEPFIYKLRLERILEKPSEVTVPLNLVQVIRLDRVWMLSHLCKIPTPMWVGFNVRIIFDKQDKQDIFYLAPINEAPVQNAVVRETMRRSMEGSKECGQQYTQVHYDLAMALKAFKIQNTVDATPDKEFEKLFIHPGAFHTSMSHFKAVGKYIDDCGLPELVVDAGILSGSSLNSFVSGKHFNRCKRIHPQAAVTIEILHFKWFLELENVTVDGTVIEFLKTFQDGKSSHISDDTISYRPLNDERLIELLEKYEVFRNKTLKGDNGKTPQFFMNYVDLINNYLLFDRSIRTSDLNLYMFSLGKFINVFFAFNHQNYARYLCLYLNNLQNRNKTHPCIVPIFSLKRTDKPFSNQPTDYAVETTINLDGSKHTRFFRNSPEARERWTKTHSVRAEITSHVISEALLETRDDVTNDLQKNRMKQVSDNIEKLEKCILERINPFSSNLDPDLLYNISSGKAADAEAEQFLLNSVQIGEEQKKQFLEECSTDPKRFDQPISKNKIYTFNNKIKKKTKDGKVEEVRIQRDLFGRLCGIALKNKIEIEKVLEYPLVPLPMALCHVNGIINKTDKSKLISCLLKRPFDGKPVPKELDAVIIDGFFYLYTLSQLPSTFGGISESLLKLLVRHNAREVHLIFDTYPKPSIKDHEHMIRSNFNEANFVIEGPMTRRPNNFFAEMKNIKFKKAFVKFIIHDWATPVRSSLFKANQKIIINYDLCYSYRKVLSNIIREVAADFKCSGHEEADTKVVFHAINLPRGSNILIKCSDTDIVVITLCNLKALVKECDGIESIDRQIWIQLGTGNHIKMIDACALFLNLGKKLCSSLGAFHSFTGCDFNPAFSKKGKDRPFKILQNSTRFQEAFEQMGNKDILADPDNETDVFIIIQEFVCILYGIKSVTTVNEARTVIFDKKYKPKSEKESFKKSTATLERSAFPPSCRELYQQFRRSLYIAQLWCNSNAQTPTTLIPVNCGWKLEENKYVFHWFDGEGCPAKVLDVIEANEEGDHESENESESETNVEESGEQENEESEFFNYGFDSEVESDSSDEN